MERVTKTSPPTLPAPGGLPVAFPPAPPWVLHVDMDQFLVAVELLRRPELVGLPVVVGGRGDPTERAVVSTASYEARAHGVAAGWRSSSAHAALPDAVFLPVDFPVYEAASARVMETLRATPGAVVEVLGWDEAFVGVETDDPVATARQVQAAVLEATGLHCSVGIGDTLVRAKIATDFGKPQGVFGLTRDNWMEVMGERPTTALWGVGSEDRRAARGDRHPHRRRPRGRRRRAAGRRVRADQRAPPRPARSRRRPLPPRRHPVGGARPRPGDDLPGRPAHARRGARRAARARRAGRRRRPQGGAGGAAGAPQDPLRAVLHLHQVRKLPEPTYDVEVIARTAFDLYLALDDDRPVRLLGVRGEMVPPEGGY